MRLEDALLDSCLCQPDAPLGGDPRRLLVSDKSTAKQQLSDLEPWLNQQQILLWANRRDAVLLVLHPLSFILLAVRESINAIALSLAFEVIALIGIAIWEHSSSLSLWLSTDHFAFILSSVLGSAGA